MEDYKRELNDLIKVMIREGASDLHLTADRKPAIRIATELLFLTKYKENSSEDILNVLKILIGEEKTAKFLKDQEVDFGYDFKDGVRLRGNAFFHREKISIALRLIPPVKTLAELNLPPILGDLARRKQGFFMAVGPVGTGKSSTLAAMVNMINTERFEHIVTIEDPIEYIFKDQQSIIDQREVGVDTDNFSTALKAAFRQDVNVIMIGEMRDSETISTAVTAAETGHLVLSTLHTNTAAQTIDRIIDSFPSDQQNQIRAQLANTLLGVFSQRLIPRIAGGLIPAFELLLNNNAVANLIRENRTHEIDVVIETSSEQGMIGMNRSLAELVRRNEVSIEAARNMSLNPKGLERLL